MLLVCKLVYGSVSAQFNSSISSCILMKLGTMLKDVFNHEPSASWYGFIPVKGQNFLSKFDQGTITVRRPNLSQQHVRPGPGKVSPVRPRFDKAL